MKQEFYSSKWVNDSIKIDKIPYADNHSRYLLRKLFKYLGLDDTLVKDCKENYYADCKYENTNIELKYRVDGYDDHIICIEKYKSFIRDLDYNIIDKGLLVSILFNEGKIYISDIKEDFTEFTTNSCNKSTNTGKDTDGVKVDKTLMHFKPRLIIYYCYTRTYEEGSENDYVTYKFIPYFSKEPIQLNKSNEDYIKERQFILTDKI